MAAHQLVIEKWLSHIVDLFILTIFSVMGVRTIISILQMSKTEASKGGATCGIVNWCSH